MSRGKTALVILAPGAEEMEVTITVDVLRRAGIDVELAGLDGLGPVTCSRGVRLLPDSALTAAGAQYDVVVLPGGAVGAEQLASSELVGLVLRKQRAAGRLIAAICAAPTALLAHGIDLGAAITCHPSVSDRLSAQYRVGNSPVVESDQLITSQGPGTSFAFALRIVDRLCGPDKTVQVRTPMMLVG